MTNRALHFNIPRSPLSQHLFCLLVQTSVKHLFDIPYSVLACESSSLYWRLLVYVHFDGRNMGEDPSSIHWGARSATWSALQGPSSAEERSVRVRLVRARGPSAKVRESARGRFVVQRFPYAPPLSPLRCRPYLFVPIYRTVIESVVWNFRCSIWRYPNISIFE